MKYFDGRLLFNTKMTEPFAIQLGLQNHGDLK